MKESGQREEWDPVRRVGNTCLSPLVDSYLTFVSEKQKQVGVQVNQASPVLEHTLIDLLSDMRPRAQVASSLAERISLTILPLCIILLSIRCVGITIFPLPWGRTF